MFSNATAPTAIYTLSLHDALPISAGVSVNLMRYIGVMLSGALAGIGGAYLSIGQSSLFTRNMAAGRDRKSTRLNSSHTVISYADFCLKKKRRPPNLA